MLTSSSVGSDSDEPPISSCIGSEKLRPVLLRALNHNQRLILEEISGSKNENITQILNKINKDNKIPLSTLKLNARILKELKLINFGTNSHFQPANLTELGQDIFLIISQSSSTGRAIGCKLIDLGSNLGSETRKMR